MRRSKTILALMLSASLLVTGCGSGTSASGSTETSELNWTSVETSVEASTETKEPEESTEAAETKTEEATDTSTASETTDPVKDDAVTETSGAGSLEIADNSVDFAKNLKLGWNLGNTLEATGSKDLNSETSWGQPKATQELFVYLKEAGFTSVRIPVSWGNHTDADYNIDAEWMARVTEVVDWALDAGLYVIINSHHDKDYYYPTEDNKENAEKFLTTVWTQIAENFKDYDERLVFEAMNEPRLANTDIEWWFQTNDERGVAAIKLISEFDQVFVDTIRSCDGYNQTRYLGVCSYCASPDFTMHDAFTIPTDPAGRLMISIHAYSPYDFAMNQNGYSTWNSTHSGDLNFIHKLYTNFVSKGYGVYIGEMGATNKDNLSDRIAWAQDYTSTAANNGIPCFVWDNAGIGVGEENFGLIDRRNLTTYFPELLDAYLSGYSE